MKKIKNEQEVVIKTLSDAELFAYAPPVVINKVSTSIDYHQKNKANNSTKNVREIDINDINKNSASGNAPKRNSSFVSTMNEYLGVGGFSKVYKYQGDHEHKAVKKIMSNPKIYSAKLTILDSVKREIFGMIRCSCEHSVKIFDALQNKNQDNFYILMEQCHGNLEQLISILGRPLRTDEVKELLNQLNDVFYKLFYYNIIHRDIKPSNILFLEEDEDDKEIKGKEDKKFFRNNNLPFGGRKLTFKLTDFGVCLPLYDTHFSKSQFMGTLDFMAPEIYDKKTSIELPIYTTKIDLFSLGQSILNVMGFIKKAKPLDYKAILELKKENTLFSGSYEDQLLADLIFNNLLIPDPDDRVNWELYFLHPFFENNEINNNDGGT